MTMKDLQVSQASAEERSTSDILGRLEAYEKLSDECQRYASLKANVEKERESVQLQIYERVRAEYEEKLSALQKDLKEQETLLGEQIQVLLEKRADLDRVCRQDNERLEEINFRTRVGEFTEEDCKAERNEIEKRTLSQSQELARIEEIVSRCTKSGLLAEEPPSSPAPDTAEEEEGEAQAEGQVLEQASDTSSIEEEQAEEPEPLETGAEEEAFQIVEEEPSADEEDSPVVHCPPPLSSGQLQTSKDSEGKEGRRGSTVAARQYITGYLVALEGSRQGERFPMISSDITLGNSPGIDIRLGDSGIANFHARIVYKERRHCLENLDTMGRTYVNGVRVAKVVELRNGDVIRLGDIKMQVEYAATSTTDPG
jgi:hypothetical protein